MSYLIVSSIQMGANIDYAIVISSRYLELRKTQDKKTSIMEALNFAFPTIITSGSMMILSGVFIARMTSEPAIVGIGECLARGTAISILLVMTVLPQILLVGDKLIQLTTFDIARPVRTKDVSGTVLVNGTIRGTINGTVIGSMNAVVRGDVKAIVVSGNVERMEDTKELPGGETGELLLFQSVEEEIRRWRKKDKGCAVIYCPTPKRVKELAVWIGSRGYECAMYTGPMKASEREESFRAFMTGDVKIMVATNAFGVGIDKPNVRLLIHAGLPVSFSGYVQEIGRSGRNGKTARCVLYYAPADVSRNERILRVENKEETKRRKKDLSKMKDYVDSGECRWRQIESYFGEKPGEKCKHCDNCIKGDK